MRPGGGGGVGDPRGGGRAAAESGSPGAEGRAGAPGRRRRSQGVPGGLQRVPRARAGQGLRVPPRGPRAPRPPTRSEEQRRCCLYLSI